MKTSDITASVRAFFTTYCTAFIRLDAPAIAKHFAEQVQVASDTGKDVRVHFAKTAEWRRTLDQILEMYRAIDFGTAEAIALASDPLSSRLVQVRIRWLLRNRAGASLYEFDALYTLARHSEKFRIVAIAHNEMPQYRRCLAELTAPEVEKK